MIKSHEIVGFGAHLGLFCIRFEAFSVRFEIMDPVDLDQRLHWSRRKIQQVAVAVEAAARASKA